MSLSGRPCSCGGRNKNCAKCEGSGMEAATTGKRRGRTDAHAPDSIVRGGFMNPLRGPVRQGSLTRRPAPERTVECAMCGRRVAEVGRAMHAADKHFPQLPRGRVTVEVSKPPTTTQPKAPSGAPRKKATRRSPPPS